MHRTRGGHTASKPNGVRIRVRVRVRVRVRPTRSSPLLVTPPIRVSSLVWN